MFALLIVTNQPYTENGNTLSKIKHSVFYTQECQQILKGLTRLTFSPLILHGKTLHN